MDTWRHAEEAKQEQNGNMANTLVHQSYTKRMRSNNNLTFYPSFSKVM
jgi:hypothetical protein